MHVAEASLHIGVVYILRTIRRLETIQDNWDSFRATGALLEGYTRTLMAPMRDWIQAYDEATKAEAGSLRLSLRDRCLRNAEVVT